MTPHPRTTSPGHAGSRVHEEPPGRHALLSRSAELPALITVQDAADLLGLSRSTAYRAVERGELPVIRFAGRMHVPVARLLRLLGVLDGATVDATAGGPTPWPDDTGN